MCMLFYHPVDEITRLNRLKYTEKVQAEVEFNIDFEQFMVGIDKVA